MFGNIEFFAALAIALLLLFVARRVLSSRGHDHRHDHDHPGHDPEGQEFGPAPDEFSGIHEGKDWAGGCKFDPVEVRRTDGIARPTIDTSEVGDPDPRIEAILADVDEGAVRQHLLRLSGETDVTIGGETVRITSRNSFSEGLSQAMTYLEEYYASLGIATRRIPYKVRGRTYFNLEAIVPGSVEANKVLIVGGHLDSTAGWVYSRERVAPGADDDGSGTVTCMTVAAALHKLSLPYTVRIVHFTGEEQGLWGSYRYSDMLADEVRDSDIEVIGMIQHDMVGYCPRGNRLDVHDEIDRNGSHEFTVAYFENIARYGLDLSPVDTHNRAVRNRSDHAGFLDHGWKAVMLSEEFTDNGFNPHYHKRSDRVQNLNIPFIVEVIRASIATAAQFAGLTPGK